jgi:UDP-glucuronate 4-epimerase
VRANPVLGAQVNVTGTTNVLEAVRRSGRIGPVVYASSIAVYGPRGTLAGDDAPGTLYGVYKRANEGTAHRYFADYGVSSIGLRPHTVFGPGRDQGMTSVPTVAMVAAAARIPCHIPFGGSIQLQYTPDVGEAFVRTAELGREGASVHNLDGAVVSITELIAVIEDAVPEARGLITCDEAPLPFPGEVDATSFVEQMGGPVMRPLADGVADAIRRFEGLLADGVVQPPEPSVGSAPAR